MTNVHCRKRLLTNYSIWNERGETDGQITLRRRRKKVRELAFRPLRSSAHPQKKTMGVDSQPSDEDTHDLLNLRSRPQRGRV